MTLTVRIEAGVLASLAARRCDDRRRAARYLEQALALANPGGYRRAFRIAGPAMRELLQEHLDSGTAHWALVNELVRGERAERPGTSKTATVEPLTDRELTTLRFLQSNLSNVEIATELSVSVNTVKTHVRHIYRKLDSTRRRDAVRRARELHLL